LTTIQRSPGSSVSLGPRRVRSLAKPGVISDAHGPGHSLNQIDPALGPSNEIDRQSGHENAFCMSETFTARVLPVLKGAGSACRVPIGGG
jgi:hypothetical protein